MTFAVPGWRRSPSPAPTSRRNARVDLDPAALGSILRVAVLGALGVLVLTAPVSTLRAQTPQDPVDREAESQETPLPALVRAFRTADTAAERRAAADALRARGDEGVEELRAAARRPLTSQLRSFEKLSRNSVRNFEVAARRVIRDRLDRRSSARLEELRDEIRDLRSGDLTKAVVHDEIDPRLEEIRALLVVSADDVLAAEPSLVETSTELTGLLDDLAVLHRAFVGEAEDPDVDAERDPSRDPLAEFGGLEGLRLALDRGRSDSLLRAFPMSNGDRRVLDENDGLRADLDPEEFDGILALNELRLLLGLSALRIDLKLCDACRDHSFDMAELGFFAHESPVEGKTRFSDRAARFGTSANSENIAQGQRTGRAAIRGWWYSPGHHKNMMRAASRVGLGHDRSRWTQLFGG